MKKITLFLFLLCFANVFGQMRIESNEKNSCTVQGDEIQCLRNPIKTIFTIDILQNRILQEEDSQKTSFMIDSKTISNQETIIYNVHTATGERLNIIISERSIKIQSLVYKEQYTEFDL